ncbi:Uncharacterised protein [Candidatus Burarchaeum australiense]|nr:Uncharacterised protein [Candidatus Burarchaeum australiense]
MAEEDEFSSVPSGLRKKLEEAKAREKNPQPELPKAAPALKKEEKPAQSLLSQLIPPAAKKEEKAAQPAPEAPRLPQPKREEQRIEKIAPAPARAPVPAAPAKPIISKSAVEEIPARRPEAPPARKLESPAQASAASAASRSAAQPIRPTIAVQAEKRPTVARMQIREPAKTEEHERRVPIKHLTSMSTPQSEQQVAYVEAGTNKLIYVALIIAVIAIYFAYAANSQVGMMKEQIRGVAASLKDFRAREVSLNVPLNGKVILNKDLPLSNIFPPNLRATGTLTIPFKTTIIARNPSSGTIYEIPLDQNVSVDFVAPLNFSKTGAGQSLSINEQIPVTNQVTLRITARDVWGPDLDAIINSLESAGN